MSSNAGTTVGERGASPLVIAFEQISSVDVPRVGGKGANLGELARAGFPVPPGFCVSTAAFDVFLAGCRDLTAAYASLEELDGKDVGAARRAAEQMRAALERAPMPARVADAVLAAWRQLDMSAAYAVRSSATAEDLPGASFAGQQDTYLNVRGSEALLDAVRRCWVSLFTDRAVLYRARGGFGQRGVKLAVVVQRMVLPDVSGILFTADPVNGNRGTVSIDAGYGLGEALVSGVVNADLYRASKASGALLEVRVGDKALAIRPRPEGGTWQEQLPDERRRERVLDDAGVAALVTLSRQIEAHFGEPQDIEWCIERSQLFVVQARPITSLYPLPTPAPGDADLHVYGSFGHFQMMTDPMPPVSIQVWRLLLSFGKGRPGAAIEPSAITVAGSRIYLDLSALLRHPLLGRVFPRIVSHLYETMGRGLLAASARPEFRRGGGSWAATVAIGSLLLPLLGRLLVRLLSSDPGTLQREVNAFCEQVAADAQRRLQAAAPGPERLREARRVLVETFPRVFTRVPPAIAAGIIAQRLLVALAERGVIDAAPEDVSALERGLPGNVTTEMDLAVGDLTDRVREVAGLADLLRSRPIAETLELASTLAGGAAFVAAWRAFLQRYGMRGPGEIDLARPRYADDPAPLVGAILGSLGSGADGRGDGAHREHHAALARNAEAAGQRLIAGARRGIGRGLRARLVRRLVLLARAGSGLREHPKFLLVRIFDLVRQALRDAGARLVERGSLQQGDDVYLFRFEELIAALEARVPPDLRLEVAERRARMAADAQRSPPFVMASDGEIPSLAARTDIPDHALSGTAASGGVVEGLARVVLDPAREVLHRGEILVAPHTDPGWTPLFVHAAGLVTEVGGLMTHGSVVAREYGIPAVVSVAGATQRIVTGQRIRVDGTRGFVELLS